MMVCNRILALEVDAVLCCWRMRTGENLCVSRTDTFFFPPAMFDSPMAESARVDLKDTGMAEQ